MVCGYEQYWWGEPVSLRRVDLTLLQCALHLTFSELFFPKIRNTFPTTWEIPLCIMFAGILLSLLDLLRQM